jgi:hypothetical protein
MSAAWRAMGVLWVDTAQQPLRQRQQQLQQMLQKWTQPSLLATAASCKHNSDLLCSSSNNSSSGSDAGPMLTYTVSIFWRFAETAPNRNASDVHSSVQCSAVCRHR